MTKRIDITFTNSAGDTELTGIVFNGAEPGKISEEVPIRILNTSSTDATVSSFLYAIRGNLCRKLTTAEESYQTLANGQELVDESWIEAKIHTDLAWTAINEWSSGLDLGGIAADSYVEVDLRLNIPITASSGGEVNFALVVRSTTA